MTGIMDELGAVGPPFSVIALPPRSRYSGGDPPLDDVSDSGRPAEPWFWLPLGSRLSIHAVAELFDNDPSPHEMLLAVDPNEQESLYPVYQARHWRLLRSRERLRSTRHCLEFCLDEAQTDWLILYPIHLLTTRRPTRLSPEVFLTDEGGYHTKGMRSDVESCIVSCSRKALQTVLTDCQAPDISLIQIAEQLAQSEPMDRISSGCLDCLAPDSRNELCGLGITSRDFNRLEFFPSQGLVRKTSQDTARLSGEMAYLTSLPDELQKFFPSVVMCEETSTHPGLPPEVASFWMEYIPFPSLSEWYLYRKLSSSRWMEVFSSLAEICSAFRNAYEPCHGDAAWLYSEKLEFRRRELTAWCYTQPDHESLLTRELIINGRHYPPASMAMEELHSALLHLEKDCQLQFVHGDLCFNNILFDFEQMRLKLIDPRGLDSKFRSGYRLGLGDWRYDACKLYHSVAWGYDAIVNDLFTLNRFSTEIELQVYSPCNAKVITRAFHECFLGDRMHGSDLSVLTASLFFSMLPLHRTKPHQMTAMLCIALQCLYPA
ncbi:phosphotransferase [Synechococcus sp. 1G10]|uniref:phosphotransferase n=1 Tax=Synechococcus sp. 1G10 TaxID=2025605 RepID=UPI00117F13C9|nr:phosphotransferase [Synechococcus sp. 1G10]